MEDMNVEPVDCRATTFVKPPALRNRRTYAGRNNGGIPRKRCRIETRTEERGLPQFEMSSSRSAPPHSHLRAGPRTPKLHTRTMTFSSEPYSMTSMQFETDFSCSAIPAAPLHGKSQFFTCSDPSEKSIFGVSRRVSRNKPLPRTDSDFALGSEPPNNNLKVNSKHRALKSDGTLAQQHPPPRKVRYPSMQHPSLQAVGQMGAEVFLQQRPVGSFLFRPGSRQCMYLSWKTGDRSYKHSKITIDVSGEQPELHLLREVYKNLHEIESHYIIPLAKYVRALHNHPNFCAANSIHEVFKTLFERQELHTVFEKQQQLYVIGPFHSRPGPCCHSFIVVFIKDGDPVKMRFQVTPKGYFVLGRRCTTPNMIIHILMEHYKSYNNTLFD